MYQIFLSRFSLLVGCGWRRVAAPDWLVAGQGEVPAEWCFPRQSSTAVWTTTRCWGWQCESRLGYHAVSTTASNYGALHCVLESEEQTTKVFFSFNSEITSVGNVLWSNVNWTCKEGTWEKLIIVLFKQLLVDKIKKTKLVFCSAVMAWGSCSVHDAQQREYHFAPYFKTHMNVRYLHAWLVRMACYTYLSKRKIQTMFSCHSPAVPLLTSNLTVIMTST